MTSFTRTLGTVILGFAFAGTAALAQSVNVNFKDPAELTGYRTYTFQNLYTTNDLVEPRLASAIDRNLQMKGWHEVAQGGDVLVTAVLANNNDPDLYQRFYATLDNLSWNVVGIDPPGDDAAASVEQAPGGTLIVDMYDSHTGQLIWRSTAGDFLTNRTGTNELRVDNVVDKMFRSLPWDDSPGNYTPWSDNG